MTKRDEIYNLLKLYKEGNYSLDVFCDEMLGILFYENGGIYEFRGKELEYINKLADVIKRYSPYKEDYEKFPNMFYSEKYIVNAIDKTYEALIKIKIEDD